MDRLSTKNSTGIAPDGRWYPGDWNALEDAVAALSDFLQTIDLGTLRVGQSDLQLLRYGGGAGGITSEGRFTGDLRIDGLFRPLGGLILGTFTTSQRDAIPAGGAPFGTMIFNSNLSLVQINKGTDSARSWQTIGGSTDPGVNTKIANYVLALGDDQNVIEMSVGVANTLTVPSNATVAFPVGSSVTVVQYGAGQTTLTPAAGVTIRSPGGALKIAAQYGAATLYKRATDEWVAMGNLTP